MDVWILSALEKGPLRTATPKAALAVNTSFNTYYMTYHFCGLQFPHLLKDTITPTSLNCYVEQIQKL